MTPHSIPRLMIPPQHFDQQLAEQYKACIINIMIENVNLVNQFLLGNMAVVITTKVILI